MTFDEWYAIWEDVYHLRGTGKNGLCMARKDDAGPYAAGNVYITTNLGNLLDYQRSDRAKAVHAGVRAKNYATKDHRAMWTKKHHSAAPIVMEQKIYYEEPID